MRVIFLLMEIFLTVDILTDRSHIVSYCLYTYEALFVLPGEKGKAESHQSMKQLHEVITLSCHIHLISVLFGIMKELICALEVRLVIQKCLLKKFLLKLLPSWSNHKDLDTFK